MIITEVLPPCNSSRVHEEYLGSGYVHNLAKMSKLEPIWTRFFFFLLLSLKCFLATIQVHFTARSSSSLPLNRSLRPFLHFYLTYIWLESCIFLTHFLEERNFHQLLISIDNPIKADIKSVPSAHK